mmetsp:Transcript_16078/g.39376  ORF Transcript_16078/g.39376 Transcript_16078/m.39376 type:complete len:214 (+) Transcript_16078:633-1274(+)
MRTQSITVSSISSRTILFLVGRETSSFSSVSFSKGSITLKPVFLVLAPTSAFRGMRTQTIAVPSISSLTLFLVGRETISFSNVCFSKGSITPKPGSRFALLIQFKISSQSSIRSSSVLVLVVNGREGKFSNSLPEDDDDSSISPLLEEDNDSLAVLLDVDASLDASITRLLLQQGIMSPFCIFRLSSESQELSHLPGSCVLPLGICSAIFNII